MILKECSKTVSEPAMRCADQTGHSSRDEPTQHKKNNECRSGSYAKRDEVKRHGSWRHRKVGHGGTSFMRSACSLTTATHCARSTRAGGRSYLRNFTANLRGLARRLATN